MHGIVFQMLLKMDRMLCHYTLDNVHLKSNITGSMPNFANVLLLVTKKKLNKNLNIYFRT